MKFILSVQAGLESIAKKEIEKVGGTIEDVTDRLITFSGDALVAVRVNLWSRVGNKVYILLEEAEHVTDFDTYYDTLTSISLKKYFKKNHPFIVKTVSERSELFAARTLQSLGKKALAESLVGKDNFYDADETLPPIEFLVMIIGDTLRVLLDTTGEGLHKRGYRLESIEAPIKENLAAGIVLLSGWRFQEPLYDVFCGSGTIAIEALMIAKNKAPGLSRRFAFQDFGFIERDALIAEKKKAKQKEYDWKYTIYASDIDAEAIDIAQENAKRAELEWEIHFQQKDIAEYIGEDLHGTLVSNPPYGERLQPENITKLYNTIDKLFRVNPELKWGIISSYMEFDTLIQPKNYKKRKLYNGGEKCYFWKRK